MLTNKYCKTGVRKCTLLRNFQALPQSQFCSIQLERSNMPVQAQKSGACKKSVEISLSGGKEKQEHIYIWL